MRAEQRRHRPDTAGEYDSDVWPESEDDVDFRRCL